MNDAGLLNDSFGMRLLMLVIAWLIGLIVPMFTRYFVLKQPMPKARAAVFCAVLAGVNFLTFSGINYLFFGSNFTNYITLIAVSIASFYVLIGRKKNNA